MLTFIVILFVLVLSGGQSGQLAAHEAQISSLVSKITDLEKRLEKSETDLAKKDENIKSLQNKIDTASLYTTDVSKYVY